MQKFNYHQHTYRCRHADMDMKDEDYIKEYIKMGFEKIAFTDHCPQKNKVDKRTRMRMDYQEKDEYLNSINTLKEKYADKIQIQSGYEVEYLPNQEENLRELKKESDIIILGQHFVYDTSGNLKTTHGGENYTDAELIQYSEYINKAMELGIPDIIAHPDLFMYVRNEFGEVERKISNMICETAEKYNIPLEININDIFKKVYLKHGEKNRLAIDEKKERLKNVLYPCKEFWAIATNYNIKVLYGLDVHNKGQILLFNELVELANEILGDEILNKLKFIE